MPEANIVTVVSHWNQYFEGFHIDPSAFYDTLERAIGKRNIPDVEFKQIKCTEGGVFSANRLYLRVSRKDHYFDICGAPFGKGYFISWWLVAYPRGCLLIFEEIPYIGGVIKVLFNPITYYKLDTTMMFQQCVHGAVMKVVDAITEERGIRALTETQRKPIMRDFLKGN